MIPRTLFSPEHNEFRRNVRRFIEEEIVPHHARWEEQQCVDRAIWNRAGALGMLCMTMPEEYGGVGVDRLFSAIMLEELARAGASGIGFPLHSDIVANYINNFGSDEQKQHWLPKMAAGETVTAIAMTEPGTGSDLQAITTSAVIDGDDYVINGDLVIVVVNTGGSGGAKNISLILVEADRAGFTKGKPLNKIGMKAQDTCELFFDNVRVPCSNLLGNEGMGFIALMRELAWERMIIAVAAVAAAEAALSWTLEYTKNRKVFGKPVAAFQNSRFKLAEMKAEINIGRVYVDRCLELVLTGNLGPDAAATAKYWCSDLQNRVMDECLQLHGGYGYMLEYPIARAWVDSRAQRIYGGTNEIMKELIARMM
jgi:alkylation response protein AidB-like acyl-CoA dehydrogenase